MIPATTIASPLATDPPEMGPRPATSPQDHKREVFGWAEFQSIGGDHGREKHDQQDAEGRPEEGGHRGHEQRDPAPPLPRHGIAVQRRDGIGGRTGDVQQDRGGRATVGGAVPDAGQHDQARHGLQQEGQREQHRHGGQRPDPGNDADYRADGDANQAIEKVDGLQGDIQPQRDL
jgi:hypothetical protein